MAEMQAYLDGAGVGLRTFVGIYPVTAAELAQVEHSRPLYYASLANLPPRLARHDEEIARAYARMEAMQAGADLGTVFYFVTHQTAGGTARQPGSLIAVEWFNRTSDTDLSEFAASRPPLTLDEFVQIVVHEGAHNLQRIIQTEPNFISIYVNPERMTLRNFAIREGAADYVAHIAADRLFAPRHTFGDPREREIWAEFQPLMNETIFAQPGWFQGRFADGRDWPIQMGYYVGYKMTEHVHSRDGEAGLRQVLSAHTDEHFAAVAARYAEKFA
ncbi:MAG: hypothetical protein AB7T08_12275 [Hyphomonadaceae bacterium]